MSGRLRIVRFLLRAYPPAWRYEYGPELGEMLLARPLTWRVAGNVLWNGLYQRLRPEPHIGVPMTAARVPAQSFLRFFWFRKSWLAAAVAVGLASASWVAWRTPDLYRAETVITVVPPRVPASIVTNMAPMNLEERLPAIQQIVTSRTRLERIIVDLDLYTVERRSGVMEDIVERMRKSIDIRATGDDAFKVAFVSHNPRSAMRVADRISSLLMEESNRDREQLMEGADQFLETTLNEAAQGLIEQQRKLALARRQGSSDLTVLTMEYEMMQNQYRSLFAKKQEANLASNMERRQIGRQFKVLEQARLPTEPFSPDRLRVALIGAGIGFVVGLAVILLAYIRRVSRNGLASEPLEEPAAS